MEEHMEDLGLNGVEVTEAHQGLKPGVIECSHRQWLEVQEFCKKEKCVYYR